MKGSFVEIIYIDDEYEVLNKAAGILSQGTAKEDYSVVQFMKDRGRQNAHLLNRIDRPVSGLMITSLSPSFTAHYLKQQREGKIVKEYIAIVEGIVKSDKGRLRDFIKHDKLRKRAVIMEEADGSGRVDLEYEVLDRLDNYSIISVRISSGKFHQIRAQLANAGYPAKGDVKYGARRGNNDRSIHLHSYRSAFRDRQDHLKEFIAPLRKDDKLWELAAESLKAKDHG